MVATTHGLHIAGIFGSPTNDQGGTRGRHERPLDLFGPAHREEMFPGEGEAERVPLRSERKRNDPERAFRKDQQRHLKKSQSLIAKSIFLLY